MNILRIKFYIESTLIYGNTKNPMIFINKENLNKIIPYIKPYFVDSMLYKLNIKKVDRDTTNNSYNYYFNNYSNQIRYFQTSSILSRISMSNSDRAKFTLKKI
jgi:hypothetical protein